MRKLIIPLVGLSLTFLASCVNEWPHPEERTYEVTLVVHSNTDWLPDYVMNVGRAGESVELMYQFQIYRSGTTTDPLQEFTVYSTDFTRPDFNVNISLNPGEYDVYVWSDVCDSDTKESLFYDTSNFGAISYTLPYKGDSNYKDAFRGMKSFSIPNSIYRQPTAREVINLDRPLARYIFIATDLEDFVERETTRGKMRTGEAEKSVANEGKVRANLEDYTVKVIYPLYMPSVFDNFRNNPIDSWTDISFNCIMDQISDEEAQLAMDYVMVNGEESGVQVMLEVYDPDGIVIARTNSFTIPTKRDRTTLIYGKFLTTLRSDGVGINPDFDGEFNIEIP